MGVILGQNRPESDLRRLRSADQYRLQYRVLPPAGRNQLININYFPCGGSHAYVVSHTVRWGSPVQPGAAIAGKVILMVMSGKGNYR